MIGVIILGIVIVLCIVAGIWELFFTSVEDEDDSAWHWSAY